MTSQLLVVDTEQLDKRKANFMRALRRCPYCRAILDRIIAGEHAAPLDRMCTTAMLHERELKDMSCLGESTPAIAVADGVFDQDVVGRLSVSNGSTGLRRFPTIRYRRQRPIFDRDMGGRIFGDYRLSAMTTATGSPT